MGGHDTLKRPERESHILTAQLRGITAPQGQGCSRGSEKKETSLGCTHDRDSQAKAEACPPFSAHSPSIQLATLRAAQRTSFLHLQAGIGQRGAGGESGTLCSSGSISARCGLSHDQFPRLKAMTSAKGPPCQPWFLRGSLAVLQVALQATPSHSFKQSLPRSFRAPPSASPRDPADPQSLQGIPG